jgi:voltage-gated potassium channel
MASLRERLHDIIFEHDQPAEKAFDVALIVVILLSVLVVTLDSVSRIAVRYRGLLHAAEWLFTILFTVEYLLRLWTARSARGYATSFYGVIDLISVLPTYLGVIFPAGRFLIAFRILRVLRVFRILKLAHYVEGATVLAAAMRASRYKITVFLTAVLTIVVVVGSLMYLIEGPSSGFTDIPQGIYWAIVTLTTVGYGDLVPQTVLGKALAATLMIVGYGVIAVPTGIVTLELDRASRRSRARRCPSCGAGSHDPDAEFCKHCAHALPAETSPLEPPPD